MKAKKPTYKLRFKPTPISRLRHYRQPIKMVGDPVWGGYGKEGWRNREKAVYGYEIDRKSQDARGFTHATYYQAIEDNLRIDNLLLCKWEDYEEAIIEALYWDYEDALRDNAAWDYHHDNYINMDEFEPMTPEHQKEAYRIILAR